MPSSSLSYKSFWKIKNRRSFNKTLITHKSWKISNKKLTVSIITASNSLSITMSMEKCSSIIFSSISFKLVRWLWIVLLRAQFSPRSSSNRSWLLILVLATIKRNMNVQIENVKIIFLFILNRRIHIIKPVSITKINNRISNKKLSNAS